MVATAVHAPAEAEAPARAAPRRTAHHPGLDGLRGSAVAAVLFFHGGFSWATGGYLGVSMFFTLSGFLITGLLVREHADSGRIDLGRFWSRRFRRLLPALMAAVVGIAVYAALLTDSDQLDRVRADAIATLGYVANWRFVLSGQAYADLFAAPSPLLHAWSLAVEEQFYVVFPLLVAGVLALARGRRSVLAWVFAVLAAGSVGLSIALHADHTRVYYGTDTRIVELLVGALLAIWAASPGADLDGRRRPLLLVGGPVAAMLTLLAWATVDQTSDWLYVGGFGAYSLVSTVLVAAAVGPGIIRRALTFQPLRALGLVSYGAYLYHWPIFLWLSPERLGWGRTPLFVLRVAATLAVSTASYYLLEQPIRRGGLPGRRALAVVPVAAAVTVGAVLLATVTPGPPGRLAAEELVEVPAGAEVRFGGLVRAVSPADPLRVLVVGDSVSYDAEPGILAALRGTGAAAATAQNELGFGLTSGTFDWRTEWARLVRELRPELVIAFFGGWDEGFLASRGPEAYGKLLDETVTVLGAGGARVLFVGMPATVDRNGVPYLRAIPAEFAAAAGRHDPAVSFLDLDPAISPGGVFVSHMEGPNGRERIRKVDGTHLCPAGSARIGRAVLDAVSPSWALPAPEPTWRAGDWALDPRFDSPSGSCPP